MSSRQSGWWQLHRVLLSGSELEIVRGRVRLGAANSHHVREVMRLRCGDALRGLVADDGLLGSQSDNGPRDPSPPPYDLVLRLEISRPGEVVCQVVEQVKLSSEPPLAVTICQCLTRPERFEYTLQKCTEIGAAEFRPVIARRSVVRQAARGSANRTTRWNRIVEEAALQSGRGRVPRVHEPVDLKTLLEQLRDACPDLLLVADEEATHPLGASLRAVARARSAAVLIGPEGGLDREEVSCLASAGFVPVSLGPRILRTETAGPVLLSLLLYELGDLGGAAPDG